MKMMATICLWLVHRIHDRFSSNKLQKVQEIFLPAHRESQYYFPMFETTLALSRYKNRDEEFSRRLFVHPDPAQFVVFRWCLNPASKPSLHPYPCFTSYD